MRKILYTIIQVIFVFTLTVVTGLIIKEYIDILNELNINDFISSEVYNYTRHSYLIRIYLVFGLYIGLLLVLDWIILKFSNSTSKLREHHNRRIVIYFSVLAIFFGLYYIPGVNYTYLYYSIKILILLYFPIQILIVSIFFNKHRIKEKYNFDNEVLPTEYKAKGIPLEIFPFSSIFISWVIVVYILFPEYWGWGFLLILIIPLTIFLSILPMWSSKNQVIFLENEVILKKVFSTTKIIPYSEVGTIYRIEDLGGLKTEFFYKGKKYVLYSGYRNEQKQKIYMQLLKYTVKDNDPELEQT